MAPQLWLKGHPAGKANWMWLTCWMGFYVNLSILDVDYFKFLNKMKPNRTHLWADFDHQLSTSGLHSLKDPQKRLEDQGRGPASSHCSIISSISFPSRCASKPLEHWGRAEGTPKICRELGHICACIIKYICITSSHKRSLAHPKPSPPPHHQASF